MTCALVEYLRVGDSNDEYIETVLNKPIISFNGLDEIIKQVQNECKINEPIVLWPRYYWKPEPRFGYIQVWSKNYDQTPKELLACVKLNSYGCFNLL